MAEDENPGFPRNPFEGMPFFADMMRAMSAQGPLNWDLATQFAAIGAAGDEIDDPDPDPIDRIDWNRLAEIADMRVREFIGVDTGADGRRPEVLTASRATWARRTLTDLRPLFDSMAGALSQRPEADTNDPLASMLGGLSAMLAPAMMGMSIGSMVGALSRHAFGQYDLPLPRPASREILVVDSSVSRFAEEWSIPRDDLRMWVLVHELASHAILSTPAGVEGLLGSVSAHVSAFRPDPSALLGQLGELDPSDPSSLSRIQEVMSDPMVLMGAVRSQEQEDIAPVLDARVAALQGYVDWVVDAVVGRLLGSASPIAEAVRRRRLEYGADAMLIERLLGLAPTRSLVQRGRAFVEGVVERDGAAALARMVTDPRRLPTPNEVDAPGLWLARLEID